jgi:hypothetical protein
LFTLCMTFIVLFALQDHGSHRTLAFCKLIRPKAVYYINCKSKICFCPFVLPVLQHAHIEG